MQYRIPFLQNVRPRNQCGIGTGVALRTGVADIEQVAAKVLKDSALIVSKQLTSGRSGGIWNVL